MQQLIVARRFHGPPDSGNGGYVSGLLAGQIAGPAEITLRAPVPLDRPLDLHNTATGLALRDGATPIAEVRAAPDFTLDVPDIPGWQAALACSSHGGSGTDSDFHDCFVCGRNRQPGDGLRVWAAHLPGGDGSPTMALAAWQTHEAFADAEGKIPPLLLWGALDCPGATAVLNEDDSRIILTGRMTARIDHLPLAGERCVVAGWPLGGEGRKLYSGTAVADSHGRILARAHITWIVLRGQ